MKLLALGDFVIKELKKKYPVKELDIGEDSRLRAKGIKMSVRSFEAEGMGHLCLLSMKFLGGIAKMETVVLAPCCKDVPLLNIDSIQVFGKKTRLVELYDTLLVPSDGTLERRCDGIKRQDSDLENYEPDEKQWSDSLRYPCSYAKKDKAASTRTDQSCLKIMQVYSEELDRAPACDAEAKAEKIREFAEGLLEHGGPAVDAVRKSFGEETTRRLVLEHMYSCGAPRRRACVPDQRRACAPDHAAVR